MTAAQFLGTGNHGIPASGFRCCLLRLLHSSDTGLAFDFSNCHRRGLIMTDTIELILLLLFLIAFVGVLVIADFIHHIMTRK